MGYWLTLRKSKQHILRQQEHDFVFVELTDNLSKLGKNLYNEVSKIPVAVRDLDGTLANQGSTFNGGIVGRYHYDSDENKKGFSQTGDAPSRQAFHEIIYEFVWNGDLKTEAPKYAITVKLTATYSNLLSGPHQLTIFSRDDDHNRFIADYLQRHFESKFKANDVTVLRKLDQDSVAGLDGKVSR